MILKPTVKSLKLNFDWIGGNIDFESLTINSEKNISHLKVFWVIETGPVQKQFNFLLQGTKQSFEFFACAGFKRRLGWFFGTNGCIKQSSFI